MELVATCRNSSSLLQICQLRKAYSHPLAKVLSKPQTPPPLFDETSCQQVALTAVWEINQNSRNEKEKIVARVDPVLAPAPSFY